MKYEFDINQLHALNSVHEKYGPRGMYAWFHKEQPKNTLDVEDMAIAFYSQYNSKIQYKF